MKHKHRPASVPVNAPQGSIRKLEKDVLEGLLRLVPSLNCMIYAKCTQQMKEKLKIKSQGIMISSCIYFQSRSNDQTVKLAAFATLNP